MGRPRNARSPWQVCAAAADANNATLATAPARIRNFTWPPDWRDVGSELDARIGRTSHVQWTTRPTHQSLNTRRGDAVVSGASLVRWADIGPTPTPAPRRSRRRW